MAKSKIDHDYLATKPLDGATTGQRVALTTGSATATIVSGAKYAVRLASGSSAPAWFEHDGTATLPADATVGTGFFLDPGEGAVFVSSGTSLSGIMVSGTGTLLVTRLDL